jgi:hypothetical protein
VEKLLFNDGLISGRILSGQGDKQGFCKIKFFFFKRKHLLEERNGLPNFVIFIFYHNREPSEHCRGSEQFGKIGHNSELLRIQNNVLYGMVWYGRYRVYVVYGMYLM